MNVLAHLGLQDPGQALVYTGFLLVVSFVWGALAANIPRMRSAKPIPHFAHNRAVAVPILFAWTILAYVLAGRYFSAAAGGAMEGLRLGLVFAVAALLFDVIVVAGIVGEGRRHFKQPVLWLGYALLIAVPCFVGYRAG